MKTTGHTEETLERLRGTQREADEQLTTARRAIAEMEARLAWSHSQLGKLKLNGGESGDMGWSTGNGK